MRGPDNPETKPSAQPLPRDEIVGGFEALVRGGKLFGAELNPNVLKKSGTGASFLVKPTPPMRRLLARWRELFADRI
ncbi:MAG: hypothetical protein ACM3NF_02405, partial [Gemmatimonadota bacterium]